MPVKREWTDDEDALLRALRKSSTPWPEVAQRLHVSISTAKDRGNMLGVTKATGSHGMRVTTPKPSAASPAARGSEPLPAGSPLTWGLISGERWVLGVGR